MCLCKKERWDEEEREAIFIVLEKRERGFTTRGVSI